MISYGVVRNGCNSLMSYQRGEVPELGAGEKIPEGKN